MPAIHDLITQSRLPAQPPGAEPQRMDAAGVLGYSRASYWPVGPLQAFTLRMASHGVCVSSAMMLGDKQYAMEQLTRAHTLDDDTLRELAVILFGEFGKRH